MAGEKGRSTIKISYIFTLVLAAFILMPALTFAQDLPCNGDDPYGPCPIDTNVWLLVVASVIAGAFLLYKQQKAVQNNA